MSENILKLDHVSKSFANAGAGSSVTEALADINVEIRSGEFISVIGPSGCGKSTILRLIAGLIVPTTGKVTLNGEVIDGPAPVRGMVFQKPTLFPWLTVEQNVAFGLDIKHVPKARRDELVAKYLDIVGLTKYKSYYPKQLSSSMLQRVSIARAFATEPELLLMDEPYGQLDIELRFKLEDELIKLWEMTKTTVIFITHNIEEAVYLGNRIMILTNKPTTVKRTVNNTLPRPRDIASPDFVALRTEVTDAIKWW